MYELADRLEPSTELDSQIRDLFSRIVMKFGSVDLDVSYPNTGYVRWEEIRAPDGRHHVTVWWVSDPE